MTVAFGLQVASYSFAGATHERLFEAVTERALTAEQSGFSSVLAVDHFYQIAVNGPFEDPMMEPYAVLSALAVTTSAIQLGALVSPVTYRNPAHLVKLVTSLDVISGGRAILGLGAGWNATEHEAYGFEFPPLRERYERLEEQLAIAREMLAQESTAFSGRHYKINGALNIPGAIQGERLPILVGGGGEKKTLRLVAAYADMCHLPGGTPDEVARKVEVLEEHCANVDRDSAEISKIVNISVVLGRKAEEAEARAEAVVAARIDGNRRMGFSLTADEIRGSLVVGDPATVASRLRPYLDVGVDGFTISNFFLRDPDDIRNFGDVIDILR